MIIEHTASGESLVHFPPGGELMVWGIGCDPYSKRYTETTSEVTCGQCKKACEGAKKERIMKVGDIVCLVSGGPQMTVSDVSPSMPLHVKCMWFSIKAQDDGVWEWGELHEETFLIAALVAKS